MKVYEVEEMAGETPISRQIVPTDTPLEAAAVGTKKRIKAQRICVRVTEERNRAVYKYTFK